MSEHSERLGKNGTIWHADDDLLARYVRGEAGALNGASLEQHLTRCAPCRARIATHVEARRWKWSGAGSGSRPRLPGPGWSNGC